MKFKALTNVRPTKDYGSQVIASPTEGTIKVTPDAAEIIGVAADGYLGLISLGDSPCVFKGHSDLGAKLASTSKSGGGVLNCSSAVAWNELGGSADHNVHFNVSETPLEISDEDRAELPEIYRSFEFYPLEFDKKVEKQRKTKKSEATDESAQTNAPEPVEAGNDEADSFDDL